MKKGTKERIEIPGDDNGRSFVHLRYQDNGDESITFAAFKEFLPSNATNVSLELFVSDQDAQEKLEDLRKISVGERFHNEQLELEPNGYWACSGLYTYDHKRSNWGSAEKDGDNAIVVPVSYAGIITPAYNKNVHSLDTKSGMDRDLTQQDSIPMMIMYIPHPNALLKDCSQLFFSYLPFAPWKANFDCDIFTGTMTPAYWNLYKPVISVTGENTCQANETIQLTVKINDPETNQPLDDGIVRNVYVESLSGYVNKSRCVVANTSGDTLTFRALDLPAGYKTRIKFGWRNITGIVDFNITIT